MADDGRRRGEEQATVHRIEVVPHGRERLVVLLAEEALDRDLVADADADDRHVDAVAKEAGDEATMRARTAGANHQATEAQPGVELSGADRGRRFGAIDCDFRCDQRLLLALDKSGIDRQPLADGAQ